MRCSVLVLTPINAWVIWEFLRKFPAFPELQATVSAFNLSRSLQHTTVCGFWYFPLMIIACYRLLGKCFVVCEWCGTDAPRTECRLPAVVTNWIQSAMWSFPVSCSHQPRGLWMGHSPCPAFCSSATRMRRARIFAGVPVHLQDISVQHTCSWSWPTDFSSAGSNILFLRSYWLL